MDGTIGIKLPIDKVAAPIAMLVKRETGLAVSDIGHRALNDECIFVCDYTDDEGLARINRLKRALAAEGVAARLFEDDEESSSELFDNMEELHLLINEED